MYVHKRHTFLEHFSETSTLPLVSRTLSPAHPSSVGPYAEPETPGRGRGARRAAVGVAGWPGRARRPSRAEAAARSFKLSVIIRYITLHGQTPDLTSSPVPSRAPSLPTRSRPIRARAAADTR